MGIFHFLNVGQGDCSIILHPSGRVTMIDICNANRTDFLQHIESTAQMHAVKAPSISGNFGQKNHPVNPIGYMLDHEIGSIHRFVLTHPDMDHMGGIEDLFATFPPTNFWDTANTAVKDDFGHNSPHSEDDWLFYKRIRDGQSSVATTRLTLYSGARNRYYNADDDDPSGGGDGLHVLAPTPALIARANITEDPNDGGYVILYRSNAGRILIAGDSHDDTWAHILANHRADVANVDILIAPHHGRDSGRSYDFLDVVRPKLTLFGCARAEHLAHERFRNRGLPVITNNQANCIIIDTNGRQMQVYVTNRAFAESRNANTFLSGHHRAYYVGALAANQRAA